LRCRTLSKRVNLHRRPQAHRRVRPPEPGVEAAERVRGRAGARSQGLRERKVRRPLRVRPVRVRKRRPRPVVVPAQEPAHQVDVAAAEEATHHRLRGPRPRCPKASSWRSPPFRRIETFDWS
jgi:hypothetical protein